MNPFSNLILRMRHKSFAWFFMAVFSISLMIGSFGCQTTAEDASKIDLSGEWKYQDGDDPSWSDPAFDDREWPKFAIPADLVQKLGDRGIRTAWLRTEYQIIETPEGAQGLVLGPVGDIDEVFVDGKKIGRTGSSDPMEPAYHRSRIYFLPPFALQPGKHQLSMRVTKWGGPGFGVLYSPIIAAYDSHVKKASVFAAIRTDAPFGLGVFLIFFWSYLMLIYSNSQVERQYWYCAGMCLLVGMYCISDSWKISEFGIGTPFFYQIQGPLVAFCGHFILRFARSASRKAISWVDHGSLIFTLGYSAYSMTADDATEMNTNLSVWFIYILWVFIYAGRLFFNNMRISKSTTSRVLFGSFIVLFICIIHDTYLTLAAPLDIYWVCYGYFSFCIGLSFFLAQDYSGALADQSETKRLQKISKELEEAISKDPLTGAFTRESFFALLEKEISRARSEGAALCLAVIDIDHFKHYNDSYGHPAGDKLLSTFGWILSQRTRTTDTCGRLGGEEFGIVLRDTSLADAYRTCDRLRSNVETFLFENPGKQGNTTISIGLASFSGTNSDVEKIYAEADKRLYEAKRSRNSVEPHMNIFQKPPSEQRKYA